MSQENVQQTTGGGVPVEVVTIHAARRDQNGEDCLQFEPDGCWWLPRLGTGYPDLAELETDRGPTRPVRIVTTDPAEDVAKRWPGYITSWQHRGDAEPCNAGFLARTARPVEGSFWWCTEHQQYLEADGTPVVPELAGLSPEQQIRAYAIQATVTWLADEIAVEDLYGTARDFEAWIRDGSVPDADTDGAA